MDIVDNVLIPALDQVGADFEQNKVFLPQLIQSAGAAQAAFEVIREQLAQSEGGGVSRGIVVLATVKGDIHDIGKNIVKVLLENYGYTGDRPGHGTWTPPPWWRPPGSMRPLWWACPP